MPGVDELAVKVEVDVPPLVSVMLVALRDTVSPLGETVVDREIVPLNPNRLAAVTVEVPEDPA